MLRGSTRRIRLGKVRFPFFFAFLVRTRIEEEAKAGLVLMTVGGSLGWKVRGSLTADFEKAAYELEPSTTANPKYAEVKTGFGYHIIMVEGRK
jgi:NIMA-interacting peptidyl-prolyl cis-trans isomerase 4